MDFNLTLEDWKYKIINADAYSLIIINFELILEQTNKAKEYLNTNDISGYRTSINKAKEFLLVLMQAVDEDKEMGRELLSLYYRVNELFISAFYKKDKDILNQGEKIIKTLHDEFSKVCAAGNLPKEENEPIMDNVQKVYSGLTYGKNSLNDSVELNNSRGFKV